MIYQEGTIDKIFTISGKFVHNDIINRLEDSNAQLPSDYVLVDPSCLFFNVEIIKEQMEDPEDDTNDCVKERINEMVSFLDKNECKYLQIIMEEK